MDLDPHYKSFHDAGVSRRGGRQPQAVAVKPVGDWGLGSLDDKRFTPAARKLFAARGSFVHLVLASVTNSLQ